MFTPAWHVAFVVLEEGIAFLLLSRHGFVLALQIAVEGRIGSEERLFVFSDGIGDSGFVQSLGINLAERLLEGSVGREACGNFVEGSRTHLYGIEGRASSLGSERLGTAVPELYEIEDGIIGRRCVDATLLSADALGILLVVNASRLDAVARGAGDSAIARQTRVVIEGFAKSHLSGIYADGVRNGAHGFVLELVGSEGIGEEVAALCCHPAEQYGLLLARKR